MPTGRGSAGCGDLARGAAPHHPDFPRIVSKGIDLHVNRTIF